MADGPPPPRRPGPPPGAPAWPTSPRPSAATPASPRPPAVRPPAVRPPAARPPYARTAPAGPAAGPAATGDAFALDVGAVLERTFSAWRANLVPFTVLAFVLLGPVHMIWFFVQSRAVGAGDGSVGRVFLALLMMATASLILTGAIPFGVFEHLRGRDHDVPSILGAGFSRILPVLGTAIVTSILTGAAFLAFCIPAFFVAAVYFVAVPVTVIEEEGPFKAVSRSYELTKGNVVRVLGLWLLITISMKIAEYAVMLGMMVVLKSAPGAQLAASLLLVPLASLDGIARAVTYHDLRIGREHSSVEDLVSVFE
jgi:hypothetical protein